MGTTYVTQDRVERIARGLARNAAATLDVASPWVEPFPVQKLLGEVLPRVRSGELAVRLVYRVAEEGDLRITDLAALETLAAEGVRVRFSRRLHAKLVIADRTRALVGSSNLTRRGGYGYRERPGWRNEEGGVLVENDAAAADAAEHFDEIWAAAEELGPDLVGVVMDFPSVREFRFVAIVEIAAGQLVTASDGAGLTVVGEVVELTTYNQSFPQMTEEMFLTQGYGGGGRRVELPDLPSLFSHPIKDHGFLVAKTFFHPESAFGIARVRVLRAVRGDEPAAPAVPIPPGSNVTRPAAALLRRLLGDGDLRLGRLQRHPGAGVHLRRGEILSKHLAVLGMTGSGKSNAVKHLLRELLASQPLRAFVVDTHGEYAEAGHAIDPGAQVVDVSIPDRIDLLDPEMVKEHFSVERMTPAIKGGLRDAARDTTDPAAVAAALASSPNETLADIGAAVAAAPGRYCVGKEEPRVVVAGGDDEADLSAPGLHVLDLRATETFEVRSKKCAVLAEHVFRAAKLTGGQEPPALVVVDEAHNYVPERTTGYMAEAARHGSLRALTTIAVEGRKFGVGLVVVSQRPSRVAKDVLAQMSSQLVFRLSNLEDLAYVRESFEAAGEELLADLPRLDPGVCVCTGTAIELPVRCDVPLFARRHRFPLEAPAHPDPAALAEAIARVLPSAAVRDESEEHVLVAGRHAEATLRRDGDVHVLDVDCDDTALAERVRAAVVEAATGAAPS